MTTTPTRQRYWPGHWLVPQIDVLKAQLLPPSGDFEKHQRLALQLEQLPYCLGATSYALCELITTQNVTVALDFASPGERADIHGLRPYERDRMGFLVDSTLEAARRAQNALVLYIDRACKKSLPTSMAELADSSSHLAKLPKSIAESISAYWSSHGSRGTTASYLSTMRWFPQMPGLLSVQRESLAFTSCCRTTPKSKTSACSATNPLSYTQSPISNVNLSNL